MTKSGFLYPPPPAFQIGEAGKALVGRILSTSGWLTYRPVKMQQAWLRRCRSFRGAKGDHFECASNVDSEKKYCAFVDYRKAVDPLKRTMLRTSIDNKILIVNQNL